MNISAGSQFGSHGPTMVVGNPNVTSVQPTGVGGSVGHAGIGGEGDANAALSELDQGLNWLNDLDRLSANLILFQGLRCGRLGEQVEAIVRFPRLFARYPFPILINSALLKLADIFRQVVWSVFSERLELVWKLFTLNLLQGSNFLKLCVLRVFQQSSTHLDKITNVDEFLKR